MSTDPGPGADGWPAREVVAIGAQPLIAGFALAGVRPCPAADAEEVRAAWHEVEGRAAVVILTPDAARALGPGRARADAPLSVVMPP